MYLTHRAEYLAQKPTVTQLVKKDHAFYRTRRFHYRVHKAPPLLPVLGEMHRLHAFPPNLPKINSNIVLAVTEGRPQDPAVQTVTLLNLTSYMCM